APAAVYRVPAGIVAEKADEWWNHVYQSEEVDEMDRPRYLLILGDAALVSWDLQIRLASDTFTGRLAFPGDAGYDSYVAKVLASERAPVAPAARALFYTVRDGTAATEAGHHGLMLPSITGARAAAQKGGFNAKEIVQLGEDGATVAPSDFLAAAAGRDPTML